MKKLLVGVIVPILAAGAVIGSGYSMWYFSNNIATASQNNALTITQVYGVAGEFTKADDFGIELDQKSTLTGVTLPSGAIQKGVHFTLGNNTKVTLKKFTTTTQEVKSITTTLDFKKNASSFDTYVTVSYKGAVVSLADGKYTFVWDSSLTFDWTDVTLDYKKEPTTISEYETMINAFDTSISATATYLATL